VVSEITADEALGRLEPEERRWIEDFRERLRAEYGERLRDLRLFGSKARGDWHDESDIDLLLLLDGNDPATERAISNLAHSISPWLRPHVHDFERYHAPISRATGFYKEMRKESVRL
jgi:uncharacterized protein